MSRVKTTITDGGLRHHQVTYHLAVQCVMEEISRIRTIPTPNQRAFGRYADRCRNRPSRWSTGLVWRSAHASNVNADQVRKNSAKFQKPCVFSAKDLPRATTRAMVRRQGLERATRMRALPSPRPPDLGRQCPAIARFPRAPYLAPRPLAHLTSCAWHCLWHFVLLATAR